MMGGSFSPRYQQPCCGRITLERPIPGYPCFECAVAATPYDDAVAVAYRERVAKRAADAAND
jgi:hypothetical protein